MSNKNERSSIMASQNRFAHGDIALRIGGDDHILNERLDAIGMILPDDTMSGFRQIGFFEHA